MLSKCMYDVRGLGIMVGGGGGGVVLFSFINLTF